MLAEATAAFTSLKTATDIVKTLLALREATQFNSQLADLLSAVVEARLQTLAIHESHTSISSRVKELEDEIERLKSWKADAGTYEAMEVASGLFAYVSNDNLQTMQSAQKLCSNCFHKQVKSFLQQASEDHRTRSLSCQSCKSKVVFRGYKDNS
jgi:DNA-directed RNA polymerase subunit RPC12/RpoP